jgi:tetratricopeptide (TPR) repeat protein
MKRKLIALLLGVFTMVMMMEIVLNLIGIAVVQLQQHVNKIRVPHAATYRILCLGDSTTYMQYPVSLKKLLLKRYSSATFSVIDKSMPCANSSYLDAIVRESIADYQPHLIIIMTGNNDRINGIDNYFRSAPSSYWGWFKERWHSPFKISKLITLVRQEFLIAVHWSAIRTQAPPISPRRGWVPHAAARIHLTDAQIARYKILMEKGRRYFAADKLIQAQQIFEKASSVWPNQMDPYYYLVNIMIRQSRAGQAECVIKKLITTLPDAPSALSFAAWFYLNNTTDRDAVIRYASQAIACDPTYFEPYELLIALYRRIGHHDKIASVLEKAYGEIGLNERLLGALAVQRWEQKKYAAAEDYFHLAAEYRAHTTDASAIRSLFETTIREARPRKITVVAMQYPMRSINDLSAILGHLSKDVVFIDNEHIFKSALKKEVFSAYFVDQFAGDFGHCTDKGNSLIAENIIHTLFR